MIEKRAHERFSVDMEVSIFHFTERYSGTIKDISKSGMYIESDTALLFNSKHDIHSYLLSKLKVFITHNNNVLGVPVRVKRLVKDGDSYIGMGVMLLDPSQPYMDFMNSLTLSN